MLLLLRSLIDKTGAESSEDLQQMRESDRTLLAGSEAETRQSADVTFLTQGGNVQQGSGNVMNVHHHYKHERYHDTKNEPVSGQVATVAAVAAPDKQRTGKKIQTLLDNRK